MFEMFELSFIVNAFLACVAFGLLLSYLGIHVVGRGIVFVDLALGQISSLGVALSDYLHFGEIWFPIALTLVASVLFSLIHIRDRRLKLEAVIGIIYVIASAVTVLVISKTPHGDADIQEVLFGSLLAVTGSEVVQLGAAFLILLLLHFIFRKHVFRLTEKMQDKDPDGFDLKDRGWNLFFYLSIGLAIVLAVRVGGVLPVFAFLVIPAVSALMVARGRQVVILTALGISLAASYMGLAFSYHFDYPVGPSIVTLLGVFFAAAATFRGLNIFMDKKS